jgi:hypothetical protein
MLVGSKRKDKIVDEILTLIADKNNENVCSFSGLNTGPWHLQCHALPAELKKHAWRPILANIFQKVLSGFYAKSAEVDLIPMDGRYVPYLHKRAHLVDIVTNDWATQKLSADGNYD